MSILDFTTEEKFKIEEFTYFQLEIGQRQAP